MNIIFYDGTCAMCHWAVKWVARHDKEKLFYFAPLEGTTAHEKLANETLPDSLVFLEGDKILFRSGACLRIAWLLGGFWKLIGWLSFLPEWALIPTDAIYRLIAKSRAQSCDLTIKGDRFLP